MLSASSCPACCGPVMFTGLSVHSLNLKGFVPNAHRRVRMTHRHNHHDCITISLAELNHHRQTINVFRLPGRVGQSACRVSLTCI
jgi:hypothetical protein